MASFEDILTKIPGVNILANMFGAQSDAEENVLKQYQQMQQQYDAYRPVAQQARMEGLENVLSPGMFGPVNNQLSQMYGQDAQFDVSQLLRDPLGVAQAANAPPKPQAAPPGAPPMTAPPTAMQGGSDGYRGTGPGGAGRGGNGGPPGRGPMLPVRRDGRR